MTTFVPFKVDIQQSEVDRLFAKLKDTRIPKKSIVPDAGNRYGMFEIFSNVTTYLTIS